MGGLVQAREWGEDVVGRMVKERRSSRGVWLVGTRLSVSVLVVSLGLAE